MKAVERDDPVARPGAHLGRSARVLDRPGCEAGARDRLRARQVVSIEPVILDDRPDARGLADPEYAISPRRRRYQAHGRRAIREHTRIKGGARAAESAQAMAAISKIDMIEFSNPRIEG